MLYVDTHLATRLPHLVEFCSISIIFQRAAKERLYNLVHLELLATRVHHLEVVIQIDILWHLVVDDMHIFAEILAELILIIEGSNRSLGNLVAFDNLFINIAFGLLQILECRGRYRTRNVGKSASTQNTQSLEYQIDSGQALLSVDNLILVVGASVSNQCTNVIGFFTEIHSLLHIIDESLNLDTSPSIVSLVDGNGILLLIGAINLVYRIIAQG